MKNNIHILAALFAGAAMLLSSCEKQMTEGGNIGFTVDVDSYKLLTTKAAPIGDPANDPDTYLPLFQTKYGSTGFKVSAYNGTTARMTGATVAYRNEWTPNVDAQWFSGETLDFYATAGSGISNLSIDPAQKQMSFDYTLPSASPANQEDILVGWYTGLGEADAQDNDKRIAPLTFHHPLAAIRIKAGDIAESGVGVSSVSITNLLHKGSCVVDMATLGSNGAITWTTDATYAPTGGNLVNLTFATAATLEQGKIIGGSQDNTFMVVPQTLATDSKLQIDFFDGTDHFLFTASLAGKELKPGKIYDITVNFKGITLETFDEQPISMIVPWIDTTPIVYNDFKLAPSLAYLTDGEDFNAKIKSLGTIREIIFDRNGSVDETGLEIQDPAHPEGFKIYASYDNGTVRITTHANYILAHQSLKGMFKDMTDLTKITWGLFMDTEPTTDMSEMFMGCSSLLDINLIDVANTKNVTTIAHIFDGCTSATRILLGNEFNTRNMTDVSYMFNECRNLQKISLGQYFDTRNVTDMSYMFCNCVSIRNYNGGQLDVGELFYTWKVQHFDYMFYNVQAHYLHFNSRFSIKSQYPRLEDHDVPTAENMMYNALSGSGRRAIFITSNTWLWVNNATRTGINIQPDGWGTTGLPQIVEPREE
ncbi:MAG: fimbrillin family protein [Bacteroidales bacterium]|nr:fimbrillin family protein [Bacteroidales bacterium]